MRTFGKVRLEAKARQWVIEAEPHVFIRLKRVFQKIDKTSHGVIFLSDTPENCRELLWFIDRYPMTVEPLAYLEQRSRAYIEQSERLAEIIAGRYTPRPLNLALPLRDYQAIAAETALQAGALLIADELGLGKTAEAIGVLADERARPALIVTLTHLPKQWEGEIRKFAPGLTTHILKKGTPYSLLPKRRRIDLATAPLPGFNEWPDVIISNYHKLSGWADTLHGKIRCVVFDECQELRHQGSAKYAAADHIASGAEFRVGLSATPIYNYGSEIYNVTRVLAPLALGSPDEFIREWCIQGEFGEERKGHRVRDPKALGVYMREQALMLRRTRKEVGRELPPIITIPHYVDIDEAPLQEVESSATELARIILTQGGQARGAQLRASEELGWRLRQATGIAKAPHVADFVRMLVESGEPVLLYGWHREVYSIWMERLKDLKPAMFTGTESPNQKAEAARRFIGGDSPVLIMSLRAGAGLDGLQEACHVVVNGELDWSPKVHDQGAGRVYRDGQDEPVVVYAMLADTGSDPVIADVLGLKRQQSEGIVDPYASAIEQVDPEAGQRNMRRLAEGYLRQRGLPLPEPALLETGTEDG